MADGDGEERGGVGVADRRLGEVLADRYRLVARLGAGGNGVVYRAEHVLMRKTVAVKVLHGELSRVETVVERFRREAEAASHIDHPHVIAATDFGLTEAGEFFLVMEYVEGRSLAEVLREEGRLSPLRAVRIGLQVAAALASTHAAGVIHRDLKPQNVFLVERADSSDFVKILDFGVARVRFGELQDPVITQAGMVFGTPRYISPEQAMGSGADPRSDLYSLGILLYEMVTGRPPFDAGDATEILGMQVTTEPSPLWMAADDPSIPAALDRLVLRLLAKRPEDRYQTADSLLDDLRAIESRVLSGRVERPRRSRDRSPKPAPGAGSVMGRLGWILLGVALTVAAAVVTLFATRTPLPLTLDVPPLPAAFVSFVTSQGGASLPPMPVTLLEERASLANDFPALRDAMDHLARDDDASEAVRLLEGVAGSVPESAHVSYLLGVARATLDDWETALAHYEQALRLDPRYAEDLRLQRDVITRLARRSMREAAPAAALLRAHPLPAFSVGLARVAMKQRRAEVRRRALDVLEEGALLPTLEPWLQICVRLRNEAKCGIRKKLVREILALGDPRALPTLRVLSKKTRGCGPDRQQDCHACLRRLLATAIGVLARLEKESLATDAGSRVDAGELHR